MAMSSSVESVPDSNESPSITQALPQLNRSRSSSSHWSLADTPQHHHHGTSYSQRPSSPPQRTASHPIVLRRSSGARGGHRSTSISSSHAPGRATREEPLSEEGEDESDEDVDGPPRDHGKATLVERDRQDEDDETDHEDDPITVKDRQSLINVEHPFGLPIWKPALYKKTRSVTRYADEALHSVPSAQAERHLLPGNIFWVILFGWWLALVCFAISFFMLLVPFGGARYSSLVFGLGWYLAWPFGKYVEGDLDVLAGTEDEERPIESENRANVDSIDAQTVRGTSSPAVQGDSSPSPRGVPLSQHSTITPESYHAQHAQTVSWNSVPVSNERTSLVASQLQLPFRPIKSYGAATPPSSDRPSSFGVNKESISSDLLGKACFWLALICIIVPFMLLVCLACWGLVITIPMAKLNWALIKHLIEHPTGIRFCAAPPAVIVSTPPSREPSTGQTEDNAPILSVKHPRLAAGQTAPSSPSSTVLLCTYRAVGWQYYKYTVGGVNIMFVNLLPVVIFTIFDGLFLLPIIERREKEGLYVPLILKVLTSRSLIFLMGLSSVIPLSYFIGMAVASISAQSSIGMGAVINATFGSVIEIILYAIALEQGKGHLVEGSIVGSLLAGVLLMPGVSMCSGALRRKEQKFNAKSAGVTSMMLIMAIIGTLTPTLFYQTYGNFQLVCTGCPENPIDSGRAPWICKHCYYEHPDPVGDPFYQSTVKDLMYLCAAVLIFSYLIGLWFSLRTHASQIWQNPQQLLHPVELSLSSGQNRVSLYHRLVNPGHSQRDHVLDSKSGMSTNIPGDTVSSSGQGYVSRMPDSTQIGSTSSPRQPNLAPINQRPSSPSIGRRVSYAPPLNPHMGYMSVLDPLDHADLSAELQSMPMQLPGTMAPDDFTRSVAVATVNALRQQAQPHSPSRMRTSGAMVESDGAGHGDHGGHAGPSWSRFKSASVLLSCTALYAAIAEILVDVVDVVLEGSGIDEKFLGITLFALVPNTTEFMNAMSFALNGNIALSMEIGSAYALQVCLLQIPAMVAFSAWYAPEKMGAVAYTFTLIFPRWDVLAIILSVFLMTYTYIEAKSNYHRGSILILSYLVLVAGFYFAPHAELDDALSRRDSLVVFDDWHWRWEHTKLAVMSFLK